VKTVCRVDHLGLQKYLGMVSHLRVQIECYEKYLKKKDHWVVTQITKSLLKVVEGV